MELATNGYLFTECETGDVRVCDSDTAEYVGTFDPFDYDYNGDFSRGIEGWLSER